MIPNRTIRTVLRWVRVARSTRLPLGGPCGGDADTRAAIDGERLTIDCRSHGPQMGQALQVCLKRWWRLDDSKFREHDGPAHFTVGPFARRGLPVRLRFVRDLIADPSLLLGWWSEVRAKGQGAQWRERLPGGRP